VSRVIASIEARMGATRLPGKVMRDIGGCPMLGFMVDRVRRARSLDSIVIATTINPADDAIVRWAEGAGVACHRGSENDVLQRVVDAQRSQYSDIVVELCGDCPLCDPDLIDLAVDTYRTGGYDVVSTAHHPSYPQGTEVQVFSLDLLAGVADTVDDPAVREHVSLYFYENPARYRILALNAPPALRRPEVRLQVDYPEDLELVRTIVQRLAPRHGGAFGLPEIVGLLEQEPALRDINQHCEERSVR
jgi:spore coat polysaccharide biosynthesis protein SpsF